MQYNENAGQDNPNWGRPVPSGRPAQRRRKNRSGMWVTIILAILVAVILLVFILVLFTRVGAPKVEEAALTATQPVQTLPPTEPTTEAPTQPGGFAPITRSANTRTLTASNLTATNAILVDVASGEVLCDRDGDAQIYPASMTKVMTLLVAAEHCADKLSDMVTVENEVIAEAYNNGLALAGFSEGETVTVLDLMYGTGLPSGAEATMSLVNYVTGGNEDAFIDMMNQKAQELGMTSTHFENATGDHDEEHYSSCHDLAILMENAMRNEIVKEVLSRYQISTTATEQHPDGLPLESKMFSLMYGNEAAGVTILAGKTGFTDQAGYCLVSYATDIDGKEFVAVTAHAPSYKRTVYDTLALYGTLHDGYKMPDNLDELDLDENGNIINPEPEMNVDDAVYDPYADDDDDDEDDD